MKKSLVIVLAFFLMGASHSDKTVPLTMSYQGRLTNAGGQINGTFDMTFRIYDMAVGGNLLWEETHVGVVVTNGLFDVILPPPYEFPLTGLKELHQDAPPIASWLEVEVEAGVPIMPRTRLHSSPFSMLSHGLAGHIFTSPGHLYMIPGPAVSDCTSVPLELAVDSNITRIRMKPYIPANDCTYVPLELSVSTDITRIRIQPPEPVTPVDSVEPAISLSVDSIVAKLELWAYPPDPIKADHTDGSIIIKTEPLQSLITVHHQSHDALGDENASYVTMSSAPATGAGITILEPQPGASALPVAMIIYNPLPGKSGVPSRQLGRGFGDSGPGLYMFNPQPEPPADPTFEARGGLGNIGPGIFLYNPQPNPPGAPPSLMGFQTTPIGAMFDMQSEPGFAKAAGGPQINVSISADTTGGFMDISSILDIAAGPPETGSVMISSLPGGENGIIVVGGKPAQGISYSAQMGTDLGGTGKAGIIVVGGKPVGAGTNNGAAELIVDAAVGSSFMLDYHVESGNAPCVRSFSNEIGAGMSIYGSGAPDGAKSSSNKSAEPRTSDSAVVNVFADTGSARIEMFGGAIDAPPSIVLISNSTGGRIGVNTDSPSQALHVVGNICATGSIGACSDERYKKNIETIDDALELINQLRGVNFNWRSDEFPENQFSENQQVGFIAQEIEKVLPEVVSQGDDGFYSVDYSKLTPVLVEAVKEQQKTIEEVKSQNIELAKEIGELKRLVQALATAQSAAKTKELASTDVK